MELSPDMRYVESHEWSRWDGDEIVCGITDYAQESLSDVVYVELPDIGDVLETGDTFGVVESVKAASDLFMPLGGEVLAVNAALEESPDLVNHDPYNEGWMIDIKPGNPSEIDTLMGSDAYLEMLKGL